MPIANAIKGAKHTGQSITWLRDDGTPVPLTGSTITARIKSLPSGTPAASDGTFALAPTSAVNITGATNTQPIEITAAGHGFLTGQAVTIASVGGNTGANGTWIITVTGVNTFTLNNSIGTGTYTSGGTATGKINVFTWAYSTADVATAGTYEVTFKADFGGAGYDLTYTQTWIVQDTT